MVSVSLKHVIIITASIALLLMPAAGTAQENLSRYYDKVLFSDDFEHGTDNWELTDVWHIAAEENTTCLVGDYQGEKILSNWVIWAPPGLGPIHLRLVNIDNYTYEADFKLDSGAISFIYRDRNQPSYPPNPHYAVIVSRSGSNLMIDIQKSGVNTQPLHTTASIPETGGWHKIEITGRGNEIQVKLDGKLAIDYIDDNEPYLTGAAAFEISPGTQVKVDNIRLLGGADTTISDDRYLVVVGFLLIVIIIISIILGLNYYLKKRRTLKASNAVSKPIKEAQAPAIMAQTDGATPTANTIKVGSSSRVTGYDVFISYSHEDKPTADAICAGLEAGGIKCWIAPRDVLPGVIFQEAIVDAIDNCTIMVVVYSSRSNNSPHVMRELSKAVSDNVIIIPFRIEDVPLSKPMEYLIGMPHWLNAITPPLEAHINELVRVVKANLDIKSKKPN